MRTFPASGRKADAELPTQDTSSGKEKPWTSPDRPSFSGGLFERGDLGEFYELIQVNLAALVHLTYRRLPGMLARGQGKIVNNARIAGYAHFPGAAVYSASKSAVVGFSEPLRRELDESPVSVLHLVTPGVETDMLEQVREDYEPYVKDTTKLDGVEPREWAEKIVSAIEDDDECSTRRGRSVWPSWPPAGRPDCSTPRSGGSSTADAGRCAHSRQRMNRLRPPKSSAQSSKPAER